MYMNDWHACMLYSVIVNNRGIYFAYRVSISDIESLLDARCNIEKPFHQNGLWSVNLSRLDNILMCF